MNELETAITATLQAEAEGAAMTTDTTHEHEILNDRLDDVDRHRRRITWVGAIAAAAAIVLVIVGVRTLGTSHIPEPVSPSPSSVPRHVTTAFRPTVSLVVPAWVRDSTSVISTENDREAKWSVCDGGCGKGPSSVLAVILVASVLDPRSPTGYSAANQPEKFLASLQRSEAAGSLAITDRSTTTVGGFPAIVLTIDERRNVSNGFGCEIAPDQRCYDLSSDWDRLAVVDYHGSTLVLAASTNRSATDAVKADIAAQFDQMLTTVRFDPKPSPSAS